METIKRNGKIINIFKYTDSFLNELISMGPDEFEDIFFITIPGMTDTEFEWNYNKQELKIIYSNYSNFYENVTKENFRNPEIINIGDYIIKEDDKYHIETEEEFKNSFK